MSKKLAALMLIAGTCVLAPQFASANLVPLKFSFDGIIPQPADPTQPALQPIASLSPLTFGGTVFALYFATSDASGNPIDNGGHSQVITANPNSFSIGLAAGSGYDGFVMNTDFSVKVCINGSWKLSGIDKNGNPTTLVPESGGTTSSSDCGTNSKSWVPFSTLASGTFDSLAFEMTGGGGIFLDDLRVDVNTANAPEPASLGLVALALGGAGIASRRRRV